MSKTTQKLGKPYLTATIGTYVEPYATDKMKAEQEYLDMRSFQEHGKPYHALTDKQKVKLHFDINVEKEQLAKEKRNENRSNRRRTQQGGVPKAS